MSISQKTFNTYQPHVNIPEDFYLTGSMSKSQKILTLTGPMSIFQKTFNTYRPHVNLNSTAIFTVLAHCRAQIDMLFYSVLF
jgi:hypothetical protein